MDPESGPSMHQNTESDDAMDTQENECDELLPHDDAAENVEVQSLSSESSEAEEYAVNLTEIHKQVQCLICLGIIRKTKTVMECLHRFCKDCIEKSMRLGNNECPACRTHCSSRRSLRDDPGYDALITTFFPNIEKYDEEEMALDEDINENVQAMQKAYNATLQRQRKAVEKQRPTADFVRKTKDDMRSTNLRRQRNLENGVRITRPSGNKSDDIEIISESGKSGVETQIPYPVVTTNVVVVVDGAGQHNNVRAPDKTIWDLISSSSTLVWGRNGQRSNTRANAKNAIASRNNRISKLVEHLRNSAKNDDELDIFIKLMSFEERRVPNLPRPYLCCRPTLSVRQLCQYVALQTLLQTEEIELYLVKECQPNIVRGEANLDPNNSKLKILTREEVTLAELKTDNILSCGYLVIAYKRKMWNLNAVFP